MRTLFFILSVLLAMAGTFILVMVFINADEVYPNALAEAMHGTWLSVACYVGSIAFRKLSDSRR